MKIEYKLTLDPDADYDFSRKRYDEEEPYESKDFCCSDMKNNWGYDENIRFEKGEVVARFDRAWSDEPVLITIEYCPWCGEKIVCVETERYEVERIKKKEIVTKEVCKTVEKKVKRIK